MQQTSGRFLPVRDQVVTNQFGTIHLDLIRPDRLFVPSSKSVISPPVPLPTPPTLDHFKCYHVKTSLGSPRFNKIRGVTVQDQFLTDTVDLLKPQRLCYAADKNDEGVVDPTARLLCYWASAVPRFHAPGIIFINNQFGTASLRRVTHVDELCVPSMTQ